MSHLVQPELFKQKIIPEIYESPISDCNTQIYCGNLLEPNSSSHVESTLYILPVVCIFV